MKLQHWSKLSLDCDFAKRDYHAAVSLGYGEVLITGGKNENEVLSDAWIFDSYTQEYRKVS